MLYLIVFGGTCVLQRTMLAAIGVKTDASPWSAPGSPWPRRARVYVHRQAGDPGGIAPAHPLLESGARAGTPDVYRIRLRRSARPPCTRHTTLIDFGKCVHERTVQESIEPDHAHWNCLPSTATTASISR